MFVCFLLKGVGSTAGNHFFWMQVMFFQSNTAKMRNTDFSGSHSISYCLVFFAPLSMLLCIIILKCVARRTEQAVLGFKAPFTDGQPNCLSNKDATLQQEPVLAYQGHMHRATEGKCDVKLSLRLIYMQVCRTEGGCCETYYSKKTAHGTGLLPENCPWCWKHGKKQSKEVLVLMSHYRHDVKA